MVFFTCQNCNAALKKSDVEKHEFRSRQCLPLFLTCIDCLKDYRGNEYQEHTSCVSEDVRYGGKDAKEKIKGVKQNKWLQVVEKVLQNPHQPADVRYIFKIIKGQPNIPRNKKKFHNFLKSKMNRNYNEKHADIVFSIFEKEEEEQKKLNNQTQVSQEPLEKKAGESDGANTTTNIDGNDELSNTLSKKERKKLKKLSKSADTEEMAVDGVDAGESKDTSDKLSESLSKKERKKLKKLSQSADTEEMDVVLQEENQNGLDKGEVNSANEATLTNGNDEPKDNSDILSESLSKKEKKKLKKLSQSADTKEIAVDLNGNQNGVEVGESKDGSDNLSESLSKKERKKLKKLSSQPADDQEMAVDVNESTQNGVDAGVLKNDNPSETLSKKERKKLKKQAKYAAEVNEIENYEKPKIDENEDPNEENKNTKKGKKRKGEKLEAVEEKKAKIPDATDIPAESEDAKKDKLKFYWDKVIIEVLKNRSDNELSLKRLSKKVINEYYERFGDNNIYDKLLKKFNKKVLSTPGIVVTKDKAKLIVEETQ